MKLSNIFRRKYKVCYLILPANDASLAKYYQAYNLPILIRLSNTIKEPKFIETPYYVYKTE